MFSKRHYEKIAGTIQDCKRDITDPSGAHAIDCVMFELADMFARDNGQFKRDRFERACVPGANVRARTATMPASPMVLPANDLAEMDHAAYKEKFYYD
jgi:hypothetical protein